jgi:hypothetical protein
MLATNTLFTSSIDGPRDDAGTLMSAPFHSTLTGATYDTTAPMIVWTNRRTACSGVPVAPRSLQFNKRIDPATLTLQNFYLYDNTTGQTPAGMVQVDPNGLTASFVPDQPWAVGRTISVYPSQAIRDTAGNQISYYGFSFSTGFSSDHDGPSVIGHNPRDGAFDVPLNTQIMVQFNEPLNPISAAAGVQLYSGGVGVPGSVALSDGNRRMTFTPAASLAPNTSFTVVPSAGVTDVAGNAAVALTSSTFTTGTQTDTQTPVVTATTPVNGASGVPTNAVMRWIFSEPMNPLSINGGTLVAYPSATGIPIAASYQLSSDGRTATLTPAAPLSPSTTYYFYTSGATDLAGNPAYSSSGFTTGSGPQAAGPMLSVLSPADNTTSVPLNARIVAVMSSALNPNSVTAGAITLTANSIAPGRSMSGDRTITFTPAAPLAAATQHTVNIAALSDLAGPRGACDPSFVTGTGASTQAPALTSIVPAYNSIDVPVGSCSWRRSIRPLIRPRSTSTR